MMDGPPTRRHPSNLKISKVSPSMQLEKEAKSLSLKTYVQNNEALSIVLFMGGIKNI